MNVFLLTDLEGIPGVLSIDATPTARLHTQPHLSPGSPCRWTAAS